MDADMTPDEQRAVARRLMDRILRKAAFLDLVEDLLDLEAGDESPLAEIASFLAQESGE